MVNPVVKMRPHPAAFCLVSETYQNLLRITVRSRIASTVQSASVTDKNLAKDEQQALARLKNDNNWTLLYILQVDKGPVTVVMDKTDYFDKMDALVNDKQITKTLNATRRQHFNVNLTAKYLGLKETDAIDNATIDWGAQYHNHRTFTDYRNCTNLIYW